MAGGLMAWGVKLGAVLLGGSAIVLAAGADGRSANRAAAPLQAVAPAAAAPLQAPAAAAGAMAVPIAAAAPARDDLVVKRVLTIDGPFRHGDYVWDADGVPPGPLIITVDIGAQTMSVFRGGYEIGAAVILFGADNKPTPLGAFTITQKDADHVSNLYDAPMPYMLRLTNDGVAIHGSTVERDSATNGCIGVPTPFARLLFVQARLGDRVIITNGKRLGPGEPIAPA